MIDFKKNGIPAILIALSVINLFLVFNKERTFTAASSIDGAATVEANKVLMYNANSKLVPSAITCSDAGDLSCKKLKVGEVNFDFSNAQIKGIAYVDNNKTLRISEGVTCSDDGAVACKKLKLGAISVDLDENTPGTLVLDSVTKKIHVSSGAKVTTENNEVKAEHIALFEDGKVNAIKPSKFKLVDDPTIDKGVMVLQNGTIKPESSATYLKFEANLPPNPKPGTVVVHGQTKNELAYYNALCFDIDNMKAANPGDYLYVNEDNKRIGAKGGGNIVTNVANSSDWKEGHLLVSTAQPKVCELSKVKLDANFAVANIQGEHLIINENNVLKPVLTSNLLRAENPNKLANLEKRLATFAPNSTSTILPSPFTIEFDPNDANNVERALVLTELNKLTLKDIKTLPVATIDTDPPALNELAIYNNATNKLEKSGLKIDDDAINGDEALNVNEDSILTVRDKVIKFTKPPVVPTIIRDDVLDKDKHYLPVMGGTKDNVNIKVSNIEIDSNNKLTIPSGEIQLGDVTISAKPTGNVPLANGMYLVYDAASTSFSPQKPAFSGITFETPIAQVQKPSHVVLDNGKWKFREYSTKVTRAPAIVGTDKLKVTTQPQMVPGLEYTVGAETSCVIFAECVAAWKGAGTKIPLVRFFLKHGNNAITRKYYAKVQSPKFSITNYVSIFQVIDTSTTKGTIQMMVETVTAEDPLTNETAVNVVTFADYMNGLVNPPDSINDLKCRMYVRKVF